MENEPEQKGKPLFPTDSDMKEIEEIEEAVESQQSTAQTEPQIIDKFIRPQAIRNSRYHHYLTKNLGLSKLEPQDVRTAMLFDDCLNYGIYMYERGWVDKDIPLELAAVMDVWLNAKRAVGMEFFKLLVEKRLKFTKEEIQGEKKKLMGRF